MASLTNGRFVRRDERGVLAMPLCQIQRLDKASYNQRLSASAGNEYPRKHTSANSGVPSCIAGSGGIGVTELRVVLCGSSSNAHLFNRVCARLTVAAWCWSTLLLDRPRWSEERVVLNKIWSAPKR